MEIKEKLNMYICEHGCHNITVDVDKGVTPFMMACKRTGGLGRPLDPTKSSGGVCNGMARSCCYPQQLDDSIPYPVAVHEWYKPDLQEYSLLNSAEQSHVNDGGLLIRPRTDKTQILHSEGNDYEVPNYDKVINLSKPYGKNFFNRKDIQ